MRTSTKTIVLIHGLWMSPRSWEGFRARYEARGFRVLTPAWPRMAGTVEELRRHPEPMAGLGLAELADHLAAYVRGLPEPPILIGHGLGGLMVEMLLDRGLGAAGVAIAAVAPYGGRPRRWFGLGTAAHPLRLRRTARLTFERFRRTFGGPLGWTEARAVYDRQWVPAPGRLLWETALLPLNPRTPARIDFSRPGRAPLLLLAGAEDRVVPPAIVRNVHRRYGVSPAPLGYREFPGRTHLIVNQRGWEEVADYALAWVRSKGIALPLTAQGKSAYTLP